MQRQRLVLTLALLLVSRFAMAQVKPATDAPMPEWDQLTSAQRNDLIAPLRDRWNNSPEERTRMYTRAMRWKAMPVDARERAHDGMQRWEKMSPEKRQQAQALFHSMRQMDAGERKSFLAKWHAMNSQQRNEWITAHPAPERRHGPNQD